ncbi:uncharacterized protein LOC131300840 [Rhododendron vialii]|uniref:uncharacterized protein LOC131300840 n=1 Tax=Rhododendron vialii TaxID=182163 RepID=UPI00265D62C5|nr:uncharacterized protein LOC131300840 [Rhododendron vialii]
MKRHSFVLPKVSLTRNSPIPHNNPSSLLSLYSDAVLYLKRLSPSLCWTCASLSLSLRLSLCFLLSHGGVGVGGAGVGVTHRQQKAHNKPFKENFPDNKSLLVMRPCSRLISTKGGVQCTVICLAQETNVFHSLHI